MFTATGRSAVRLLLLLLVAPATGTFLQWSLCDDSCGSGTIPYGLNARLVRTPGNANAATSRLVVNLARHQSGVTCRNTPGTAAFDNDAWPEAMVQLDWNGLRRPESFSGKTKARLDCEDFIGDNRPAYLPVNSSRVSMTLLDDDIGVLPALSTLRFQAYLNSPIFAEAHCIASLMTPAIPLALSSGLRYGSLAVFLFVFLVSGLRTIAAASGSQHQNEDQDSDGGATASAPVLPCVSDCLHFLQFVFLTGGLSLFYPGFYPAAVGHLNWFALFADLALPIKSFVPGPTAALVRMASTYPGINDGLYEVNGTYGGYLGLEVMTQMVGAPMTCDTWLLMVLFTACIAAALGLFLWLLETVRPRNVLGLPLLGPGAGTGRWALVTRIGNGVLRLVLSYITLPLIAMSTYQLNFSGSLGAGHMSLAIVVLLLITLAFAWLAVCLPMASLGALVFEAKHSYQRVGGLEAERDEDFEEERQARRDHRFVMALFVLNMTRGLTIGGLQKWGVVQLAVLVACEVVMLLAIWTCRPFPLLSGGFAATLLRLAILACFVPFTFPPSKMFNLKTVSAYVALSLYVVGLIGVFFVPSGRHLYRLALQGFSRFRGRDVGKDVPVVSLRQLQRREAPGLRQADDLGATVHPPLPVDGNFTYLSDHGSIGSGQDRPQDVSLPHRPILSHGPLTPFYRLPRSSVPAVPGEASRVFDNGSRRSSPSSPLTPYPAEGPPLNPAKPVDFSPTHSSSSMDMQRSVGWAASGSSSSVSVASEADTPRPLGPRWDDYSFREADLFYARPPPPQVEAARQPLPASESSSKARQKWLLNWSLLRGWDLSGRKLTLSGEKGFSVVRPSRVPHPVLPPATRAAKLELGEDKSS
ncbi:Histidine phosphatase superfamily, clade-1 [Fusarium keratoplasticum]|uniref:Histidine phosphatase superfamily, clade-1 n=1 Tax=Fusarium keratoplasticum TaxID=1328300 RepID=A0ACC0QD45_9HYPO|nr:Histidine phosphatase superfamily, clade-1 [Fusarium keratoplasticum]KAI8650275.1 Histidine phosphatase superfamily, clade-1 [Fusarium keratoplasticum]KAI8651114.1 Histidine phosphatase superfamily, clade-1 [Fusarium keratoplasticum]